MPRKDTIAPLIQAAEREAQLISALARLGLTTVAVLVFVLAGGVNLPVAPVVLTYFATYALISLASAIFSRPRFFTPSLSLLFTAIDGAALALLIGFALRATGSALSLHGAVPGFVFFFCILILATMRYTVGPALIAFVSFALTWWIFAAIATPQPDLPSPALSAATSQTGAPDAGPMFFFGPVQNAARWGFLGIATLLSVLAVLRRRKTLVAALSAAQASANLSRYLPDRIADTVARQGIDALKSGRKQHAAIVFVDIRGFTGLSERLPPEDLGPMLGEFRALAAQEIEAHSGYIEKFIGDSVMAVFGVPTEDALCDAQALGCATALANRLNAKGEQPGIRVTIGAHCGQVYAGAVGTTTRMEFTVLGDVVNIAARLQERAKSTASGLTVSKDLLSRAGMTADWHPLPDATIRGRQGQVPVYEYLPPSFPL